MRSARWLLCAFVLLGAAVPKKDTPPPASFKEPDGFAGLRWGASISEAEKLFQVRGDKKDLGREIEIKAWITVGEMILDSTLTFIDGGFVSIVFSADENYKDTLVAAFQLKYGPPTMRLPSSNFWHGRRVTIILNTVAVSIGGNRSIWGSLGHDTFAKFREQQQRESAGEAAKGL